MIFLKLREKNQFPLEFFEEKLKSFKETRSKNLNEKDNSSKILPLVSVFQEKTSSIREVFEKMRSFFEELREKEEKTSKKTEFP